MTLVRKTSSFRKSHFFISMAVMFFVYGFLFSNVFAETNNYTPTSGTDTSGGNSIEFSENDIQKLSASDSEPGNGIDRMRSKKWPDQNQYDENRYIEFIFSAEIPENAIISEVKITHEFQRSSALAEAKIEVWNGENFIDQPGTTLGTSGEDHTDIIDVTSVLDTPEKINNTKIRFLAYRATVTASGTTTGHDFIGLSVIYDISENPDPDPDPNPEPESEEPFFTKINEDIEESTTWSKENSPYILSPEIYVKSGAVLTVEPGVIVKFDIGASLVIEGKIEALGGTSEPIYFTSLLDDSIGGDIDGDSGQNIPSNNDWNYFLFNSPEESVLNNVFLKYTNEGLILINNSKLISDYLNVDTEIMVYNSNAIFNNLEAINLKVANSQVDIEKGKIENPDGQILEVMNESSVSIKDSILSSDSFNSEYLISVFDGSDVVFDTVQVNDNGLNDALVLYQDSSLEMKESSINSSFNGFIIYNNSIANISNSVVNCQNEGFSVYDSVNLNLDNSNVSCNSYGFLLYNEVKADINNSKISGALNFGLVAYNNTDPLAIEITGSEITNNEYGFLVFNTPIKVNQNKIYGNFSGGAVTIDNTGTYVFDFIDNWWGDRSGPFNEINNSAGLGDMVSDYISFSPWCENPECKEKNPVLIIPGIIGTYLYKNYDDYGEIWLNLLKMVLPGDDSYLNDLILDINGVENPGKQMNTGDILRKILFVNIFDGLIEKLEKNGYSEDKNLFVFPYDWRKSNIQNAELLKDKINQILKQTGSSRVDILAHSMGGVLAKEYISQNTADKIDSLIFLGTPHLGAPKAFKTLMFGDDMNILFLNPERLKIISQNMPSVYELLPSQKYVEKNESYVKNILDSSNIKDLNYDETKDFMLSSGRNQNMFPWAEDLHYRIDDLDLSGVDVHNFIGCGTPTIRKIEIGQRYSWVEKLLGLDKDYILRYTNGDKTVPLMSADQVFSGQKYFVKKVTHSSLPSADGVKESILAILNGEELPISENILSDVSNCTIEGDVISTHSPVEMHIYDEAGNHTGPNENGDLEYGIEGVEYDILGEENYAFLPDGSNFRIVFEAENTGGYDFEIEKQNSSGEITKTYDWNLVPLETLNSKGEIWLGPDYSPSDYSIEMDNDGDGKIDERYKKSFNGLEGAEKMTQTEKENSSSGSVIKDIKQIALLENQKNEEENKLLVDLNKSTPIRTPNLGNIIEKISDENIDDSEKEDLNLTASLPKAGIKGDIILVSISAGLLLIILLAKRFIKL